jgi:hypothetical protein
MSDAEQSHDKYLVEANAKAAADAEAADRQVLAVAQATNAVDLYVAMLALLAIAPVSQVSEGTHGEVPARLELLAYLLYPLFGQSGPETVSGSHAAQATAALSEAFNARRRLAMTSSDPARERVDSAGMVAQSVRMYSDVVRGSAYVDQTEAEITEVQGAFERWFASRLGIGPARVVQVLEAIHDGMQRGTERMMPVVLGTAAQAKKAWKKGKAKVPNTRTPEDVALLTAFPDADTAWSAAFVQSMVALAPALLPVGRDDLAIDPPLSEDEWAALVRLLGLIPDVRTGMTDPADVRKHPLIVLPDDKVLLTEVSNACDVVWDVFEEAARQDPRFYDHRYQKWRAAWLESRLVSHLQNVFPPDHVYSALTYPDPDKPAGATTELDAAVKWGPFLILAEAKAKQFRQASQRGDIARLRSDIKANVAEAFQQAQRALRYIRSVETAEFTEISTGRKLSFRVSEVRRTYLLAIPQHELFGLTTRLAELKDLGFFRDGEYPVAMSIADLEVVTRFSPGPDVFLHYLERRTALQKHETVFHAEELDLFGAYLDSRLQTGRFTADGHDSANMVWLSGFSERFDEEFRSRHMGGPQPRIRLNVPPEIEAILDELRTREDDAARWIAFSLLDMSDEGISTVAAAFRDLAQAEMTPNAFRRMAHQVDDTVIVVLAMRGLSVRMLQERTRARAEIEKYRRKAKRCIAFGLNLEDRARPFDSAIWIDHEWEYDQRIEEMMDHAPPESIARGQRTPGRNDRCFCGSGKKYKSCHGKNQKV